MAIEKLTLHHVEGPRAGQSDSFRAGVVTVGRSPDTTLPFATERGVSSRHAEIRIDAERIELVDNNSTNGTFVNDERVTQRELKPGDLVRFGYMGPVVRIDYAAAAAPAPPPAAPPRPVAAASTMFIDEAQLAATRAEAAAPAPAPVPRPAPAAPRPVAPAAYPQAADVITAQPVQPARPPVRPAVPAGRAGAAAMAAVAGGGGQAKFVLIGVGIAFVVALLLVLAGRALIGG